LTPARVIFDSGFYEKRAGEKNPTSDNPEMTGLVNRISGWCRIEDGARVLDLGCYDGYILRRVRARAAIEGVGIDLSQRAVTLAKRAAERENLDGLAFVVSEGSALPFPDASFNVVICSEILEHVPDLDAVLSEIARVLVGGGRLYATIPNSLRDVWRPLRPLCRKIDEVEGHVRRMTLNEFIDALERWQLEPIHVQYRGFILSALWYSTFIYNPRIKRAGLTLITNEKLLHHRAVRFAVFAAMRIYLGVDSLFRNSRACMGIDVAMSKAQDH